ncbi:formate dehydrogenase subunit gamma [Fuchsiella alkaliacetigena]|uniref:formate dehydrogenase subunit gamma n=1 Tax=Fuchsiella alkaliacetigena TaxID=957042 RepID=UPI00200A6F31|nr:cytochrome b/b6 domain-containing protein [Fuchsiella alkaliacetigena]MCK8824804.1 cytochrome b/b6 domain-containing protein [Fuchsiella alkaliacetigena]
MVEKRIERNNLKKRFLHWTHTLATLFLYLTGLSWYFADGGGFLGNYQLIATVHRISAAVFIVIPLGMLILNFEGFKEFLREFLSWSKNDTKWLLKTPSYFLNYDQADMPTVEGRYNPGQKFAGWLIIGVALMLVGSGIVRVFFIHEFSPSFLVNIFSLAHRVSMAILGFVLIGHIFLGAGIFKPYRGMWRAMFGDGTLKTEFAKKHWPRWVESKAQDVVEEEESSAKLNLN